MDQFWKFMTVGVIVCGAVLVTILVLLSLPKSRLRSYLLEIFGWGATVASAVSVVSPIDAIPDFIPVLGQLDDLVAIAVGICSLIMAVRQRQARARWQPATVPQRQ